MSDFQIRDIRPEADDEIALVANRMRETLREVLGDERGTNMYSMEWLTERVRWHLDTTKCAGRVFVVESTADGICGHAIARVEEGYGYFSTLYVAPGARGRSLRNGAAHEVLETMNFFQERPAPFFREPKLR